MTPTERAAALNATFSNNLHALLGMSYDELETGHAVNRLEVRPELFASNGFLHAAAIVALADSACGHGCMASLPDGAEGFTTLELKANYLGTVADGELYCEAKMAHGGRTTQVWDAVVRAGDPAGKTLALFRCTQLILYPRAGG